MATRLHLVVWFSLMLGAGCNYLWDPWLMQRWQHCESQNSVCPIGQTCNLSLQTCEPMDLMTSEIEMTTSQFDMSQPSSLRFLLQTSGSTSALNAVWGSGTSNVWAVGASGTILGWDGIAWGSHTSGTTNSLSGIWGSNANRVWAVGTSGTILMWNGLIWVSQTSGTLQNLSAIWGNSASSVWVVGAAGTIVKTI